MKHFTESGGNGTHFRAAQSGWQFDTILCLARGGHYRCRQLQAAKQRFQRLQELQADLSQKFSEHVLDATDGYACYASTEELAGVPADAREASRAAAAAEGKAGHKVTLHFPSYFPVMQYGENRALRERLYTANATRASEMGPPDQDNSEVMRELIRLRQEEARLLGYPSYAELSLVPKMAASPQQVMDFLRDLARRARPHAERDLADAAPEMSSDPLVAEEIHAAVRHP